jgi:YVTN family beta-propeller protein
VTSAATPAPRALGGDEPSVPADDAALAACSPCARFEAQRATSFVSVTAAILAMAGCASAPPGAPSTAARPPVTTRECAWVTSFGGDDVCGVEVPSGRSLGCVRTGSKPHGIAVSRDGARVFVSNEGASTLSIVDARGRRALAEVPVGARPNQLALTPDGKHVWVLNNGSSSITVVDAERGAVVRTVPSGRGPHIIATNAARNAAVVTAEGDSTLELFDLTTFERRSVVSVFGWPRVLAVTADGATAFLTIRWLNGALVVGLDGAGPRDRVALGEPRFAAEGKDAHGIALTPAGDELLLTTQLTGQLTFIDPRSLAVRGEVHVGNDPNWVEVTSDGRFAVVSNTADDTVAIVDVAARRVKTTAPVGRKPKRLAVGACVAGSAR